MKDLRYDTNNNPIRKPANHNQPTATKFSVIDENRDRIEFGLNPAITDRTLAISYLLISNKHLF